MAKQNTYDAGSISVLEGLEAVRKRPGMYIGSVSRKGLNHLIYEIVDNAVDEHLAGYCSLIHVVLEKDGSYLQLFMQAVNLITLLTKQAEDFMELVLQLSMRCLHILISRSAVTDMYIMIIMKEESRHLSWKKDFCRNWARPDRREPALIFFQTRRFLRKQDFHPQK